MGVIMRKVCELWLKDLHTSRGLRKRKLRVKTELRA